MEEVPVDKVDLDLIEERLAGGLPTPHQPSYSFSDDQMDVQEPLSDDEDEQDGPRYEPRGYLHEFVDSSLVHEFSPTRTPPTRTLPSTRAPGRKRTRDSPSRPDLESYLSCYALSNDDRIRMCRAYASYLVSLDPSKVQKKKPKK